MKRYACHRLYTAHNLYFPQSVVVINDEGEVMDYASLTEETPATEWLGGVIFLSPRKELGENGDIKELLPEKPGTQSPLYAWHLSPFDFVKEAPVEQSLIRLL